MIRFNTDYKKTNPNDKKKRKPREFLSFKHVLKL